MKKHTTKPDTKKPPKKKLPVAEPLLPAGWGVPQVFRDRLGEDVGRQRLMQAEGHLLLVLHAPPRPDEPYRRGRLFWRNAEGLWKPQSLTHSEHAIGELITEYEVIADELEQQDEAATEAKDYFEVLTGLAPLVRAAHNVYTVVQEARQAVNEDRKLILLRDRAYALNRRIELLQQDTKNTLDFVIARQAEEQARAASYQAKAAHRLNMLAAFFFPLATLSALFGMELRHGFESLDAATAPLPMLLLICAGLFLGTILAAFVARK